MKFTWPQPLLGLLFALCSAAPLPGAAHAAADQLILAAHEARRQGELATLQQLAATPSKHVLMPYVRYWHLSSLLAQSDALDNLATLAAASAFLDDMAGSQLAERLRSDWLRQLAGAERWTEIQRLYAELRNPDQAMRCLQWQARLNLGDDSAGEEIRARWSALDRAPAACTAAFESALGRGLLDEEALWQRARRQVDTRQPENAFASWRWLPPAQAPAAQDAEQAVRSPAAWLDRLPANFATRRSQRELAIAALTRLARADARVAFTRLLSLQDRFSHDERAHVHAVIAMHAAIDHFPEALDFYRATRSERLTPLQRAWRVRAALRAGNWAEVEHSIKAMPASQAEEPEWIYWLARALAARGDHAGAAQLHARIAADNHFYGLLAAEALGRRFAPPPAPPLLPAAKLDEAERDPSVQRALALFRLDLRTEGVREWVWALRDRDEQFRLAAAHIALRHDLYDRAINSAELANARSHFDLRFLTPYREFIEPEVRAQGLDLSWIYGLMRQESRFAVPARSSAGAQGLMQVMPATGKWVANKIGLRGYHPRQLAEPQTNVLLGTSYMRLILDDLDRHPVLASAAYNAGPGRAQRWRDQRTLEGAIYIETIPFDETRDYVKKVLANTTIYAAILEGRSQSLMGRLGSISPRPGQSG